MYIGGSTSSSFAACLPSFPVFVPNVIGLTSRKAHKHDFSAGLHIVICVAAHEKLPVILVRYNINVDVFCCCIGLCLRCLTPPKT